MQTVASLVSTVQDLMEELKIPATSPLDNRILGSLAVPSSTGAPVLQTTEVMHACQRALRCLESDTVCIERRIYRRSR